MNDASGVLPAQVFVAVLLTFPASYLVLRAFRYQMQRVMLETAGLAAHAGPSSGLNAFQRPREAPRTAAPSTGVLTLSRLRARMLWTQVAASLCAAALSTFLYLHFNPDVTASPLALVLITYAHTWPLLFALQLGLDDDSWTGTPLVIAYVGFGLALAFVWSALAKWVFGRADVTVLQNVLNCLALTAIMAAPPYLVLRLVGARWMRSVSSLLLAALLVFCFGGWASRNLFFSSAGHEELRAAAIWLGETGFLLVTSIPIGYACWRLQRFAGRHYERKRFSDTQLQIDAVWIVAAFSLCFDLSVPGGFSGLWALSTFVLYRAALELGLRSWKLDHAPPPRRLLVLRVFGNRRRSEVLFDRVAQRWRLHGNVNMIAGADLAARTLDPGDLLLFMSGSLRSRFVHDRDELERQVAALDEARDPDGRFRINDFFCFEDTWQPALERLIERSDLVLMDLRDFDSNNRGCVHEIRELARLHRLGDTLFVLDAGPGAALLRATVAEALAGARAPQLHFLSVRDKSRKALHEVVQRLQTLDGGQVTA